MRALFHDIISRLFSALACAYGHNRVAMTATTLGWAGCSPVLTVFMRLIAIVASIALLDRLMDESPLQARHDGGDE